MSNGIEWIYTGLLRPGLWERSPSIRSYETMESECECTNLNKRIFSGSAQEKSQQLLTCSHKTITNDTTCTLRYLTGLGMYASERTENIMSKLFAGTLLLRPEGVIHFFSKRYGKHIMGIDFIIHQTREYWISSFERIWVVQCVNCSSVLVTFL